MIGGDRNARSQDQFFAVVDHQAARLQADVDDGDAARALLRSHAGVGRGHRLEHGFFHRQVGQMRRRDQRLMLLHRSGHQVDIGFQARAHAPGRLAEPGAPIQDKILRRYVQNHPVALERHVRGEFHRVGQIVRIDFAGAAELVQSAALRAMNRPSSDAESGGFDGDFRAPLGVGHGGANGFGHGVLIGDAALGPAAGNRQPIGQTTEVIALKRADHAARARASHIQTHRELCLTRHTYKAIRPTPPP